MCHCAGVALPPYSWPAGLRRVKPAWTPGVYPSFYITKQTMVFQNFKNVLFIRFILSFHNLVVVYIPSANGIDDDNNNQASL